MADNTKNRITRMLLSKSRRAQYVKVFAVLAVCVTVAVAVILHQSGIAMTHEEQVLTCPVTEVVAHTHNESCYDADGNLVCTLPELELHTHTEECYNEEGELICGKEEITEEHVHGPGCFTTVEVEDGEPEAEAGIDAAGDETATGNEAAAGDEAAATAEVPMPAQSFEDKILDDKGNLWVHVSVEAPEGAFPENTTMRIAPLDAEAVRAKVEDALTKDAGATTNAKQMKAVDIVFYDAAGNEIEPAAKVEVKLTTDTVRNIEDPVLVHVNKDESKDAEVLKQVDVVNQNEQDTTKGTEDTLKFESNEFSPYVIVEPETITANVITANGETYAITVSYGEDAGIPAGATLKVSEVLKGAEGYETYAEKTSEALETDVSTFSQLRMFDISIVDAQGTVLEPKAAVEVKIEYVGTGIDEGQELKVVHLADEGTEIIDPAAEGQDGKTDTLTFSTNSFSIYSVVAWQQTSDLDGKTFAIVHQSTTALQQTNVENNTRYLGRALQATATSNNTARAAANVVVEEHESGMYIVSSNKTGENNTADPTQIAQWTFTEVEGKINQYYIQVGSKYLHIGQSSGWLYLSDDPQAITVETSSNNKTVRLKVGNTYVRSSVKNDAKDNGDNPYFGVGNAEDGYCWLTLCQIEEVDLSKATAYTGSKVSVQDLADGESYIIYKNVYNENTDSYEDYVIDANGNLTRAYDKGDSVTLYSETAPFWMLKECKDDQGQSTGYYVFKNEQTGLILHPLADGTLVKEYAENSSQVDGVVLAGRESGEYTSTIEYWDQSAMAHYGYKVENGANGIRLASGTGSESMDFSFAKRVTDDSTALHTVGTVDSSAQGINIHMFNYPDRATIANVTGSNDYTVAVLPAQHVKPTLSSNGYPQFNNGNTGQALFDPAGSYYRGTGNHLFLDSIYNSTGYYEYSCFNNFAHYDATSGQFTVYAEQGTPSPTSNNFFYKRGNFLPYNELNTDANANRAQNLYNGDGKLLDYEDPTNTGTLYGLKGSTDFYFGMTMDFSFIMPRDGNVNGSPLIYEFNGDDDLWIYIDGVLVLDIGGVHDAWSGKINFATGEIVGRGANGATTIKECFRQANVFPDGTTWDDAKVDQYFKGNTFVEYGSHTFNMFYMEHGAGASNLETRFNLPVIEKGKVEVSKQLSNTTQDKFANVSFAYQLFKKTGDSYTPVTAAVYKNKTDEAGNPVELTFHNGVKFSEDGQTYNNVFYLKPNETAIFSDIAENQEYYVQELGVKSDYYDEILINDVKIDGENVDAQDGVYRSSDATPRNRASVTFTNHCDERNSNELLITKRVVDGTPQVGDTFEFRVLFEDANGNLAAYNKGAYYIRDDKGVYYRYQNGKLVSNGETPYELKAGTYGTIAAIPPNYTVVIKDLLAGTDFYVDEIRVKQEGATEDVLIGNSDWKLKSTETQNADDAQITNVSIYDYATSGNVTGSALGAIAHGKDAQVTFTNELQAASVSLKKVDENNEVLSGASFNLTKWDGEAWAGVASEIKPGSTAENGETIDNPVSLGQLRRGRYRLEEASAPNGYNILSNKFVYFEVYAENGSMKIRLTNESGKALKSSDVASVDEQGTTVIVKNTPGSELPHTGGIGTTAIYATGALLVGIAGYGLVSKKMRNNL